MPSLALATANKGLKGDTGSQGPTGAPGAGSTGLWAPSSNGLVGAPFDPVLASTSATKAAGILYFCRVRLTQDTVITNMHCLPRTPAGAGLSNTYLGIYTVDGTTATLLAQTNDISTQVTNPADVKAALSAPTSTLTAGTVLLLAFLSGASTTAPTLRNTNVGAANTNLTGTSPYRYGTFGTGLTALPATMTLSSTAAGAVADWFGLS